MNEVPPVIVAIIHSIGWYLSQLHYEGIDLLWWIRH